MYHRWMLNDKVDRGRLVKTAGHRGYNGASYFRYIDKLKVGDLVSVTNLWETLTYRVCEIKIIDPHDVTEILIQPGRDCRWRPAPLPAWETPPNQRG